MTIYYTARARFGPSHEAWDYYINQARLPQLTELISLDTSLNEVLVEPDYESRIDYNYIVLKNGGHETGFFTTWEYVLTHLNPDENFHLLAVCINPDVNCNTIEMEGYDFIGYELLDQYYDTSALTNCGGFDETFLPSDLNKYGLIDHYAQAIDIGNRLYENNPGEDHADTNVIAIWKHK